MTQKDEFFHPRSRYHGKFKPENLIFNANLQEFASKVDYICCLKTGGKIRSLEAYERIKTLWQELDDSKKQLKIGKDAYQSEEDNSDNL